MNKQILRGIVLAGLFAVPFIPFLVSSSLFFPFITTKAFTWRIIVEVVFAAWAVLALLDADYRPRRSKLLYALIAFIVIIGLADLFGAAPVKSFWSNAERMEGFVSLLHLGMFFAVISGTFKEIEWRRWWNTSLVASLLMCAYGIFQLLGVLQIHQGGARVDGSLGNAAYLAVYLLFHIFMASYLLIGEKSKNWRWFYISAIFFNSLILYFTATRGAILGVLGGLLIAALLSLRNRERPGVRRFGIYYVSAFALIVIAFFSLKSTSFVQNSPVLARFATISASELKTEGRAFVWPMAVQGVKERPLLGWGQENFNYVFNEHYRPEMYRLEPWFDRAHNIFLDWAIAGGLLGLLSYLSLYALFLYYLWKPGSAWSYSEKSILTGLLAAYFFHNLFVFDHLISYILFASLLAYAESRSGGLRMGERVISDESAKSIAAPLAGLLLLTALYFVNIRPIIANSSLISAMQKLQSGQSAAAAADFRRAHDTSRLGRPEIVEQIATNAPTLLSSATLTTAQKNEYFVFARNAVETQANGAPTDARYQLLAGSFLTNLGQFDAGEAYLKRALELMPSKQAIYFQLATAQIAKKDVAGGLATLKKAYELAPEYKDAQTAYLVGAIYAGDRALEGELRSKFNVSELVRDDRIASAYYATGRYAELVQIFRARLEANPTDPQNYVSLVTVYVKVGQNSQAIAVLRELAEKFPTYKAQAEEYIKQIQNGTLKI